MNAAGTTRTVQVLDGKHLLNAAEAAGFLGVSTRTLRRLTEARELPSLSIGSARRWRVDDLVAYARPGR